MKVSLLLDNLHTEPDKFTPHIEQNVQERDARMPPEAPLPGAQKTSAAKGNEAIQYSF